MPIRLSDRQSTAVASAAAALSAPDRDAFHQAVARQLAGREVGDGAVGRAIATAFQLYFKPPELPHKAARWGGPAPSFEKISRQAR